MALFVDKVNITVNACGHVENYTDTYPRMEYEEVDDDPGTG